MRGFTLNTSGETQLNFDLLNVIDDVTTPLDEPRVILVYNLHKIKLMKRSKKPSDINSSSTSASSISTPSNCTPTDTPKPNSMMGTWKALTF